MLLAKIQYFLTALPESRVVIPNTYFLFSLVWTVIFAVIGPSAYWHWSHGFFLIDLHIIYLLYYSQIHSFSICVCIFCLPFRLRFRFLEFCFINIFIKLKLFCCEFISLTVRSISWSSFNYWTVYVNLISPNVKNICLALCICAMGGFNCIVVAVILQLMRQICLLF